MTNHPLLLCLDYGTAKVGVAIGSLSPTTPLDVIRYANQNELLHRIEHLVTAERPEGVVVGWPADHLDQATEQTEVIRQFGERVGQQFGVPVVYYPETLTTQLALKRMVAAGIPKLRRRQVEDSFAAAAILDSYLESL